MAFEYDGPMHSKKRDSKRDQYLFNHYGLRIMRVTDLKDPSLKQSIIDFVGGEK